MNILLTNDDGYEASGITELFNSLSCEHKVFIVAPKDNCSGMIASISLRKEIEVEQITDDVETVDSNGEENVEDIVEIERETDS